MCKKCQLVLPLEDFAKNKQGKNGRRSECKPCNRKEQQQTKANNPEKRMLYAAQARASRDKIPFNLTLNDIKIPTHCPVYGTKLQYGLGSWLDNSPSLDKVVPSLGYIKGNVRVISHLANRHKNDMGVEQLEALLKYVKANI